MSNYNSLKTTIDANIKQNGRQEITGQILNSVLNQMVTSLGAGYQFMGVATPTNPGTAQTPDYKCFYLATIPGTYTNLGGLVVADGEVAILKYDSTWTKDVSGIATAKQVALLERLGDTLISKGIMPLTTMYGGILNGSIGNAITEAFYSGYISKHTDMIPVKDGEKYYITTSNFIVNKNNFSVALLDSEKKIVSSIVKEYTRGPGCFSMVVTIPEGIEYAVFQSSLNTQDADNVSLYVYRFDSEWDYLRKIIENIYGIRYDIVQKAYLTAKGTYNVLTGAFSKVTQAIPCLPKDEFSYDGVSEYGVAGWIIRSGETIVSSGQCVGKTNVVIEDTYVVDGVTYVPDSIQFSSYGVTQDVDSVVLNVVKIGSIFELLNENMGEILVDGSLIQSITNGKYLGDSDGAEHSRNTSWAGCAVSGFIDVVEGKTYSIANKSASVYSVHAYGNNQSWIEKLETQNSDAPIIINIPRGLGIKYIRVCWLNSTTWDLDLVKSDYLRMGIFPNYIDPSILAPGLYPEIDYSGNVLYGKKWVACGDSFTQGDFSGLSPDDYKFQDSPYKGRNMVYPFFIGRRNKMTIVNEAISGSIMALSKAYVDDPDNVDINTRFPFSYQRYKNIPADADYITLWFGINDAANTYLGTIDDVTNETFYGAWNVVLQYLIEHHPTAKIGIIVTNGGSSLTYKQAVRDVALKWGIPFLDMTKDPQVPPIFERDASLGYSSVAQQLRTAQFRVSAQNGHPNVAAHEYESIFIENWLRSL